MMKKLRIIWLFASVILLAACSDSGIDDPDSKKTDEKTTETSSKYVKFEKDVYQLSATATTLRIYFTTNIDQSNLKLSYTDTWYSVITSSIIKNSDDEEHSALGGRAAGNSYYCDLDINPNEEEHSKIMKLIAYSGNNTEVADTMILVQDGTTLRTSTSKEGDGDVEQLLEHTRGNGIPIVLMGDGFGDQEVADGTYRTTMVKAIDNLFSEQPLTALKDYFDIYMVTVVSNQNDIGPCYDSAFDTEILFDGTAAITGDDEKVKRYASRALSSPKAELDIVILNNNNYGGTTYMWHNYSKTPEFTAVCYCPIIGSIDYDLFREVLVHEVIGHGFAKLSDEYYEEDNTRMSSSEESELLSWQSAGYYCNVSIDRNYTSWADFLNDSYYTGYPEKIGAYEGGYTYKYGVWRPSYESMMNTNETPFNAPSRKIIYDTVMLLSGGTASTYDEFKAFDLAHYPDFSNNITSARSSRSSLRTSLPRLPHPVVRVAQ